MSARFSLRCHLFGHVLPTGYQGGTPYLRLHPNLGPQIDGLGTEHAWLAGNCERCGKTHTFAMLHLPERESERKLAKENATLRDELERASR